jgi:putative DNA primase/helicase
MTVHEENIVDLEQRRRRDKLPKLSLDGDPVAVAKKLAALIAERDDILLNGHVPVRVVCENGQEPHAAEMTNEALRAYAYEICMCERTNKKKEKVAKPLPSGVAQLYLRGLEGSWGLRSLRGISTAPLLGHDGSVRHNDGYDKPTCLWCHNVPKIDLPMRPTKDEATAALLSLRQAFATFPFADAAMTNAFGADTVDLTQAPGLDESTHLAALLTAVCRPCLSLAPGFLYEAPTISGAGTGKGLLAKSLGIISSGAQPSAMTAGHNAQELDKRLVSAAIAACPVIYLDNFNEGMLQSDTLASFLTEDPARVRVLGESRTVPLYTRTLVVITGNAVTISEDMARRVLKICIDAKMEDPEQRVFNPGFLEGIFDQRAGLLSAALTIWRWGIQQGNALAHVGLPVGSFERWARWCRDPLLALGCRDPIERISQIKAADPRRAQVIDTLGKWWEHHGDNKVTATDLHADVKELIDTNSKKNPITGELIFSRQKVAAFLRKHVGTRVGGFLMQCAGDGITDHKNAAKLYKLTKEHTVAASL